MGEFWGSVGLGVLFFLLLAGYYGVPMFITYLVGRQAARVEIQRLKTEEAAHRVEEARLLAGRTASAAQKPSGE